jgi:hypothetical protein
VTWLPRLLALSVWASVGLAVTTADGATAGGLRATANGMTFSDVTGDVMAGGAPDITAVRVENDDSGEIIIQVRYTPRSPQASDFVGVFLDTDQNVLTGKHRGAEWALALSGSDGTLGSGGAAICRAAPEIDCRVPQGSYRASYSGEAATFTLNRSQIEVDDGFDFWVGTSAPHPNDPADRDFDFAPGDVTLFRYVVAIAPPCVVPNVKGKTLAASRSALGRANCTVGAIARRRSSTVAKGRVISSRPRAGSQLPSKGKVDLVVSAGR